jgi:hypothetical protein
LAASPAGVLPAEHWRQFTPEHNRLLAFCPLRDAGAVFDQGFYKRTDIYAAHPVVDDIVGGLLGLLQGFVILTVMVIILNSHVPAAGAGRVTELHSVQDAFLNQSHIAAGIRDTIVPPLVHILSGLLPADLVSKYP